MGTFERLSIVTIGVILVMILVVAVVTWTEEPAGCVPEPGTLVSDLPPAPPPQPLPPLPSPEPPGPAPLPPAPPPGPLPPAPTPDPVVDPVPAPDPAPAPSPGPPPEKVILHVVEEGETLIGIAVRYLELPKHWQAIARENGLQGDSIRPGQTLRIPTKESLGLANAPDKAAVEGPGADDGTTVTVQKGEDLAAVARRALRDADRWPDLWLENRELLPDPSDVREGMVLSLPR